MVINLKLKSESEELRLDFVHKINEKDGRIFFEVVKDGGFWYKKEDIEYFHVDKI